MPQVRNKYNVLPELTQPEEPEREGPGFFSVIGAAAELENDVLNALELLTRPRFTDTPGFNPLERLKDSEFRDTHSEAFVGVGSEEEFLYVESELRRELRNKQILASAGFGGVLAAMAMGVLSPTSFIPLVGVGVKGLKAVGQGITMGLLAGASQEVILQANQRTRSTEESLIGIGSAAVLGGILGGAVGYLGRRGADALGHDMAYGRGPGTIHPSTEGVGRTRPVVAPRSGTYRVQVPHVVEDTVRALDDEATYIPTQFQQERVPATEAKVFTIDSERTLVFSPESAKAIAAELGVERVTLRDVIKLARQEGFDAIGVSGFDEIRNRPLPSEPTRIGDLPPEDVEALRTTRPSLFAKGDPATRTVKPEEVAQARLRSVGVEPHKIGTPQEALHNGIIVLDKSKVTVGPGEGFLEKIEFGSGVQHVPVVEGDVVPRSAGAAARRAPSAGGIAPAFGLERVIAHLSPVVATINQSTFKSFQWGMAQLADAGVRLQGNAARIATSPGGTAENRIATWYGNLWDGLNRIEAAYAKYWNNTPEPTFTQRAVSGVWRKSGKLTRMEFAEQVTDALNMGDVHEIPEVAEAARGVREAVLQPMFDEATASDVQLFTDPGVMEGVKSYFFHDFNVPLIEARYNDFLTFLANHIRDTLTKEFDARFAKYQLRQARSAQAIEDLSQPLEEAQRLRDRLLKEMNALEGEEAEVRDLEDMAALARMADLEEDAKRYAKEFRERRRALSERRGVLRERIRNLNRTRLVLEERQRVKLDRIDRIEELQLNSLRRVLTRGQKLLRELDGLSDEALDRRIQVLRDRFAAEAERFDRAEERLVRLAGEGDALPGLEVQQMARAERLTDIAERLGEIEGLDREAARQLVQDGIDELLVRVNDLNNRRALRAERLRAQAENLDPRLADVEIARTREQMKQRELDFREFARIRGADDVDLDEGVFDFTKYSMEAAEALAERIAGTPIGRLQALHVLQGERGPELARYLNIDYELKKEWLVRDARQLLRNYVHTMAPDLEIKRKFGDVKGETVLAEARKERDLLIRQIGEDAKLSAKEKEKKIAKIRNDYKKYERNFTAVVGRLRHTWGLPANPDGVISRLGHTVMRLNVLRYMGSVLPASVPDLARPVMKYGILRTFGDGFGPYVRGLKEVGMLQREAKLAGGPVEGAIHARSRAILDHYEDLSRKSTKLERGIEFASSRMGWTALFDTWTDGMKHITYGISSAKILDSIRLIMETPVKRGPRGELLEAEPKAIRDAYEYLASLGIDGEHMVGIWKEVVENGGGERVNGVWLPNTEAWQSPAMRRAFRAAVVKEARDTIVTPGVERPLIVDETLLGKIIFQFRSFALSSTTKTILAGAQQLRQGDMAIVNGTILSLALGALSYYIWAVSVGGEAYEEMLNAPLEKWADEAIDRSGILGVFGEALRIGERIPGVQRFVRFSDQRTTRRGGEDLLGTIAGPTFDFVDKLTDIAVSIDDPTMATLHKVRLLLPYQNLFYLRQLWDQIEQSTGEALGLPERRS